MIESTSLPSRPTTVTKRRTSQKTTVTMMKCEVNGKEILGQVAVGMSSGHGRMATVA